MTIGWVRFDSFPDYRINAMYVSVLRDNGPAPTGNGEPVGSTNYTLQFNINTL